VCVQIRIQPYHNTVNEGNADILSICKKQLKRTNQSTNPTEQKPYSEAEFIASTDPKIHYFVHKSPSTPKPSAKFCAGFYSAELGTCPTFVPDNYCFSLDCVLLIFVSSSHNPGMPCPDDKDPLNMDFTRYQSNTTHKQEIKQHNKPNHEEA